MILVSSFEVMVSNIEAEVVEGGRGSLEDPVSSFSERELKLSIDTEGGLCRLSS